MSMWTHVFGTIKVEPLGHGEHAREFVLREVLDHLPPVTGSEGPMGAEVVRDPTRVSWSSADEFGQHVDGPMRGQSTAFFLVLHGDLRDRAFAETEAELDKWLETLARRVHVRAIAVRLDGEDGARSYDDATPYYDMLCWPSTMRDGFETTSAIRRCPDWREGFMPDMEEGGNWSEMLVYLLPSGPELLAESDERGGHAG